MAKTQVNSATGIMGVTGSGKSSLAATLADYLWLNWRRVLLLYSSDGGGFPAEVQSRIALGTIRVFRMRTRDLPNAELAPETCYRACQMWWPKKIDPRTGEVEPGVEMVPPVAKRWEQYCKHGHLVKSVIAQSLLTPGPCPQCAAGDNLVTAQNMRVEEVLRANKGFADVGGVFFDGLSSMLSWILLEMGHRAGRTELKGEEGAIGGKVRSGDLTFGGVTRSHVGFAQTRGEELVSLTMGIRGLMVPPVFTMLTHEDVDDRALSIRGPKIAGRAKTDEAPAWFGNMLESQKIEIGNQTTFSLRLTEFTDAYGVKHLCKNRAAPGTMPDELTDPVDGPPFSEFNLGNFFTKLDAALSNRINEVAAQFPDAPGLPDGIVEIGEPGIQKAATGVVTVAHAQALTGPPPSTVSEPGTPGPAVPQAPPQAPKAPAAKSKPTNAKKAAPAAAPPAAAPVAPAQPVPAQPVPAQPVPAPPVASEPAIPSEAAGPAPGVVAALTPPATAPEPHAATAPAQAAPAVPATPQTPAAPAAPPAAAAGSPAQAPRPTAVAAPPPGRRPTPPAAAPRPPQAAPRPSTPPPTTT